MVAAVVLLLTQVQTASPAGSASQGSAATSRSAPAATISGTVRDASGSVVPGAVIAVRDGAAEQQTVSGPDGRFTLPSSTSRDIVLIVRATGFAELRHTVPAGTSASVDLVLSPASLQEAGDVTPTGAARRTRDGPAAL